MTAAAGIDEHAAIGDGRSAALVAADGTIDWLCWPRFDSDPAFASLLDPRAGCFAVRVPSAVSRRRAYVPGTNVLETTFVGPGGAARLVDAMLLDDGERTRLRSEHELLRTLVCLEGEVDVAVVFEPRSSFGLRRMRVRDRGALGIVVGDAGGRALVLRSTLPLDVTPDGATGRVHLRAGERVTLSLVHAADGPAVLPSLDEPRVEAALSRTIATWRRWSARLRHDGPYRDAVERSALALALMVYPPSGAVVAAPTTSLPERIGASFNWDYRYCWLRDAAFTVRALESLGFEDEADGFASWLLLATRLSRPELRVLYDVFGRSPQAERDLTSLAGAFGSRPVRVGNAADEQVQLDVYGEVAEVAARRLRHVHGPADRETQRLLVGLGEVVCRRWREGDDGIWESRCGRRLRTHSLALGWGALDALLDLARRGVIRRRSELARFARERDAIRAQVEAGGYDEALGSYVSVLGGRDLDASLLLLGRSYADPRSPRMRGTYERVRERLGAGGPLLYRHHERETEGEGAFAACSFWAADLLARGTGTLDEARGLFEAMLGYANDVGLFAEEIDPATGAALGNFPQGLTHVAVLNAAISIEERARREREGVRRAS